MFDGNVSKVHGPQLEFSVRLFFSFAAVIANRIGECHIECCSSIELNVLGVAQHVDLRDWLGEFPGIHSETLIEQAIPLTSYNQVISLLWLP